jgi:hypothetical protein
LPLLRLGRFPLLKQPQAAPIRGDFGSVFARHEPFAGTPADRATREIAMWKRATRCQRAALGLVRVRYRRLWRTYMC